MVFSLLLSTNVYSENITIKCVDEKRDVQLILNFDEGGDWINFNGQSTPAARDSFNHASLTDNGTGDYTIALTSSMGNANYSCAGNNYGDYTVAANSRQFGSKTKATGSLRTAAGYDSTTNGGLTSYDSAGNDIHFMGDLA